MRPDEKGWWDSLLRVMVIVQPIGACIEISFRVPPPSPPPYRIDNRTPFLFVARQKGAEQRAHAVPPNSQAPFAWAESSLEHVLLVSLNPVRPTLSARPLPAGLQLGWRSSEPDRLAATPPGASFTPRPV